MRGVCTKSSGTQDRREWCVFCGGGCLIGSIVLHNYKLFDCFPNLSDSWDLEMLCCHHDPSYLTFHLLHQFGYHNEKTLTAFWHDLLILYSYSFLNVLKSFVVYFCQEALLTCQYEGLIICGCWGITHFPTKMGTFVHVSCHQTRFSFVWFLKLINCSSKKLLESVKYAWKKLCIV